MARFNGVLHTLGVAGLVLVASCSEASKAPAKSKQTASAQRASAPAKQGGVAGKGAARAPSAAASVATGSLAGAPIAERGLLGRLPKSSLFALRLPHVELLGEAWKRSVLARMWEQPAVAHQLEQALAQLGDKYAELETHSPEVSELLKLLPSLSGELVLAVEDIDPTRALGPRADLPFALVALYEAGDQAVGLRQALEPLLAKAEKSVESGFERKREGWGFELKSGPARFDLSCVGTCFEARLGPAGSTAQARAALASKDSLLASELVRGSPDLARDNATPCAELYLNLAPAWTLAKSCAPPEVAQALSRAGLDRIEGLSLVVGLAPEGLSEVLTLRSPGGKDLFSRALSAHPLNAELARWIPAGAEDATLCSFDLATLYQDVRAALPPEALEEMDAGIDMLRRFQGVDLCDDVILNFGPTFAFASKGDMQSWTAEDGPEFVFLAEVRDAAKARRALERSALPLLELKSTSQAGLNSSAAGSHGTRMPTWALEEHCLVVASDGALAQQCLQAAHGSAGISNEALRDALASPADGLWLLSVDQGPAGVSDTLTFGHRTAAGLVVENRAGAGTISSGALIGGVAIVAAIALPSLLQARPSADEVAAIATLRNLCSAQAQAQASGAIDVDGDGVGEYGYLAELAGSKPLRARAAGLEVLDPPVLSMKFGAVSATSQVSRSGYLFQVWLPAASVGGRSAGIAEDAGGGKAAAPFPDADNGEVLWCCYAWPVQATHAGKPCFFINQEGDILQTANVGAGAYAGALGGPGSDAAYAAPNDMHAPLGIDGLRASDGRQWTVVGR